MEEKCLSGPQIFGDCKGNIQTDYEKAGRTVERGKTVYEEKAGVTAFETSRRNI